MIVIQCSNHCRAHWLFFTSVCYTSDFRNFVMFGFNLISSYDYLQTFHFLLQLLSYAETSSFSIRTWSFLSPHSVCLSATCVFHPTVVKGLPSCQTSSCEPSPRLFCPSSQPAFLPQGLQTIRRQDGDRVESAYSLCKNWTVDKLARHFILWLPGGQKSRGEKGITK